MRANALVTRDSLNVAGRLQQPVCRSANGNVQILPAIESGHPAQPDQGRQSIISITEAFKIGGDALFVSDQYFVGDESNQAQRLASYASSMSMPHTRSTRRSRSMAASTISSTTATPPTARSSIPARCPTRQWRGAIYGRASVSPARPRAFYAGLKATF